MKFYCFLLLPLFVFACKSAKIAPSTFYIPEPCSLLSKNDISVQFPGVSQDDIRISVAIDMSADSKLCAYGWQDENKNDYILDLFLSGTEDLQRNSPYGKLDFYIENEAFILMNDLGDHAAYIPMLVDNPCQRLVVIKGNYAIDFQSQGIHKDQLVVFARKALDKLDQ